MPIKFVIGSLENLPFEDESFDAVYSGYVIEDTDLDKSIPEIARTLKPERVAYLVILITTKYDKHSPYDVQVNEKHLKELIQKSFEIVSEKADAYQEVDQHGNHKHTRTVLILKRKK